MVETHLRDWQPAMKPVGQGRRLLTIDEVEVAEQLGVTRRTVQHWIKDGLLACYALGEGKGTMYRTDPGDLEAFLKKHHRG